MNHFQESFTPANFIPVPQDWHVIITDVIGSTQAIKSGKYKDVNIAGGLSVVALANGFKDMEFPFVFGGDGVTFLVPSEIISDAKDILIDTKFHVKELYDLELRIGVVPVADLIQIGKSIHIGKLAVSKYYDQAILNGSGLEIAESWVKKPNSQYLVFKKTNDSLTASFEGFTCRWQDVQSSEGETVALIVKVREDKINNISDYYDALVTQIMDFAGDETKHHPIKSAFLKMTAGKALHHEVKAKSLQKSGWGYIRKLAKVYLEHLFGFIILLFRLPIIVGHYKLQDIRNYNIISSDYRKYDGALKMVLSVRETARKEIETYLQNEFAKKNIFYGMHISDRALLTCLVHTDSTREVHFVDAADGGYALAAQQMKEQIAR